jgi:cytosine deaminase
VRELLADDVDVALGQDDISDAYYPYGRNNMLEVAFLASHLLWMTKSSDMEKLYDMITTFPSRVMRIGHPGVQIDSRADLVVLPAPNILEALRNHDAPKYVVFGGNLVDQARMVQLSSMSPVFGS